MKKLFITLTLGAFIIAGCNATTKENKTKTEPTLSESAVKSSDGETEKLTKERFLKEVWDYNKYPQEWKYMGDKPAIIDFYADWCGPCKVAAPILDEVSNESAGKINAYKIDTQRERELAGVFGIQSIPAFLYIPMEGKPIMMAGIGRSKEETKEMFVSNINKYLLKQ